jgi:hypothetical protein
MTGDSSSPLLTLPSHRSDRWKLVREIIRQWYPEDCSKLGLPTGMRPITAPPVACTAIQEWHAIVRESPGIWCQQDHLFGASGDWRRGDYLTIAVENQATAYWGIPRNQLEENDPPVFLDGGNGKWELENATTSEFALAWLISCIKWSRFNCGWANGQVNGSELRAILEHAPRLALSDWRWPAAPTRFYGTFNVIVETNNEQGDCIWLWVSARKKTAYQKLQQIASGAGVEWEASSDEWPDGWVSSTEDYA